MKTARLENMTGGWFVGDFEPNLMRTDGFEAACKHYKAGDTEDAHVHKVATEITLIASGRVKMCGQEFTAGDIILLEPGDVTAFEALADTITFVVKTPSVMGDKYLVEEQNA